MRTDENTTLQEIMNHYAAERAGIRARSDQQQAKIQAELKRKQGSITAECNRLMKLVDQAAADKTTQACNKMNSELANI